MFCPNCKLEYRAGFTRCSDCDVPLVASLDDIPVHSNAPQNPDAPEVLWTGTNSAISSAIADALHGAGVSYHEHMRDVGLLPGMSQPVYMIMIHARDHIAAQTALENARRQLAGARLDLDAADDDTSSSPQGSMEKSLEAEDADDSFAPEHDYVAEDFDPDEATAGVWAGADADMKNMLISCLRENGIGCAVDDSESEHRICVRDAERPRSAPRGNYSRGSRGIAPAGPIAAIQRCAYLGIDSNSKVLGEDQGPVLAWQGDDPVLFSCALAALNDKGILSFQLSDHKNLMRGVVPRPGYGIFVRMEDLERAEEAIRVAFDSSEPPKATNAE